MVLHGYIGTEIEVKTPAEKLYTMFKQSHKIPNISNLHIKGVEVHEGDWETHGSIKVWNYELGDHVGYFKEKVEYNDEKKAAILVGIEGEMFKYYKKFKGTYQFTEKEDGSNVAILWIDYAKVKEDIPAPENYVSLMVNLVQDLDSHFVKSS